MKSEKNERGFTRIVHPTYSGDDKCLVSECSNWDYDSYFIPGSNYLWLSDFHYRLNREEIRQLVDIMQFWLDNKKLPGIAGGI